MLRLADLLLYLALLAAILLVGGLTLWWLIESVAAGLP